MIATTSLASEELAAPSLQQALLLQAATLPAAEAVAAWRQWQTSTQVDALEPDSQWLLPLLYANLRRAGVDESALRRYASVYRHNWYKNQLLLRAGERVLSQEPEPLLLGAAALAIGYYPHLGARPIASLAVLCPEPRRVKSSLEAAGWQLVATDPQGRLIYADAFGRRVALWSGLIDGRSEAGLLARAQSARLGHTPVRLLSALDQLVWVLALRDAGDNPSRLLWAADAAQILRKRPDISLAAVLARARLLEVEPATAESWRLRAAYGLAELLPE